MNFLYFSTLTWDEAGGAHNPTQMTRALARRGHAVVLIEPQPSATREKQNLPIEIVALTELGMPLNELRRAWFGLETGELETVAQNLMARVSQHAARLAIFSAPFDAYVRLVPFLRARGFLIVYYAMDDFAAAPALGYTQFLARAEEYLARESDVLLGVTPHVVDSLKRFSRDAQVIPNGVDARAFQFKKTRAAEIARGELTLGFWGTVMESMFDAELAAHVARARPRWNIHLLGAVDPEAHRPSIRERLKNFPNIFLHGVVPHDELPQYAAAFDVALAPFPDNAFTRGRDPIKVYEYLAAHLPVAASYAPQLEHLPGVHVAYTPAHFVTAIESAAQTRVEGRALDEFLQTQSWDARAECLLQAVSQAKPRATKEKNDTILTSFAQPDANAVMRYARALEHELTQTQRWARELEQRAQANPSGFARLKRRLRARKRDSV